MFGGEVWSHLLGRPLYPCRPVLLAWELGGGMGHVQRLRLIARELTRVGVPVAFALRDRTAVDAIRGEFGDAEVLQAPWGRSPPGFGLAAVVFDYTDLLYRCGYDSANQLWRLVAQWNAIFDRVRPLAVIADHSPTAVLAAAPRFPVVHLGSGFATPPAGRPFLPLYPDSASGASQRRAAVIQAIQDVQAKQGRPAIAQVADIFDLAEVNLACCLPELDPYRATRPEAAIGPLEKLPPPQPAVDTGYVFGYLSGDDPRTPLLIESLVRARVNAGLYIRTCTAECVRAAANTTVRIFVGPQPLPETLARAAAVIHHGGLSTTEAALAVGRPQFLFPRYLEQTLTAKAVYRLNCGIDLNEHRDPGDFIARAVSRRMYRKESGAFAAGLAQRNYDALGTLTRIAASLLPAERTGWSR